ncbi:hypothetical protein D9C11_01345 [Bacillus subtilis subsp. subtilis]|nr:hypothetical protein D9C11_01345 [Bacillus subtilis subsp. subtilis]
MGALFLHLKPDEYLKKLYKTKKLVEKTSFSLQAERRKIGAFFYCFTPVLNGRSSFTISSYVSRFTTK